MYLQNYSYHSWKLPKSYQTWYKIKAKTQPFYSVVGYANHLTQDLGILIKTLEIREKLKKK